MNNKGQARWVAIFLLGLTALIGVEISRQPIPHIGTPAPEQAQNFSWSGSGTATPMKPVAAPVLVSGTAGALWLAEPLLIEADNEKRPAFKLLQHEADKRTGDNQDLWNLAQEPGKPPVILGSPVQLVAAGDGVYVLMENGVLIRARLAEVEELTRLPAGQKVVSSAGSDRGLFALTRGPIFDTTEPATSAPASEPAADVWNLLRYTGGAWVPMVLGRVGDADVPGADARVLLAEEDGQVALFWYSPKSPRLLLARVMNRDGEGWSEVSQLDVGEEMTRLLGVSIAPQSFVLWPVSTNGELELHGRIFHWAGAGAATATAEGSPRARELPISSWAIAPLKLGAASTGLDATRDVGIGRTANSLMAVMAGPTGKEGDFTSLLFDATGRPLAGPMKIVPAVGGDSLLTENVILAVITALLLVSLWNWRRRPTSVKLPKGMKIPLIRKRVLAGVIDLGLPLIGVITALGLWHDGKWWQLLVKWGEATHDLEMWNGLPEVMWVIGIYVAHVLAGELIFGRSLGKALVGMRVVSVDGQRAGPLAIILRNLMRLPELAMGVLLLYVLVNDQRQRLGDWLGGTVVVENGEGTGEMGKGSEE